ncbi:MAG: hypothetical protein JRH16_01230 [Deltaproteobacteria bacterium]|nr:hypothetical protein [Deltaproteobacteria bacterium]MBW2360887.1 hypothetical protein [Deltaproteobacteria bacterium]
MPRADWVGKGADGFVLYLEGPGDRGILDGWCRRLFPEFARQLSRSMVILGGKQPDRAVEHFQSLGGAASGRRALCVLDRDDGGADAGSTRAEPGLEFFTWRRRHIESYLLVPSAIERALRLRDSNGRVVRALRDHLPAQAGEDAYRVLDAKRLLAPGGPVSRSLGRPLPLAKVARATRSGELHEDVHDCFARVRAGLGIVDAVVLR